MTLSKQFKMHIHMALKDSTSPSVFIVGKSSALLLHSSLSLVTLWSHQLCHIAGLFKENHTRACTFSFAQICNPDLFCFRLNIQVPNSPLGSFSHLQPTCLLVDYTKPFKQTWLYSLNDFMCILPSR